MIYNQLNTSIKLLVLSLLFCALAIPSFAYDFMVDGIAYKKYSAEYGNKVYVTYSNYNTDNVRDVNYPWLTSVDIPESVTYDGTTYSVVAIGSYAFKRCFLTSVRIPNSVVFISNYAFHDATVLSINIPESMTKAYLSDANSIGEIKWDAKNCETVELEAGCFSIGSKVEKLPSGLYNSIYKNGSFTALFVPKNVKSVGAGAFSGTNMKHLIFEDATDLSIEGGSVRQAFAGRLKEDVYFMKGEQIPIGNYDTMSQTYYLGREVTKINTIDENTAYNVYVPTPPEFSEDIVNNISQYEESRGFRIPKESTLAYFDHPQWSRFALTNDLSIINKLMMKTKSKTMNIGESFNITVQFTGETTAPTLKWSTNPKVAQCNDEGKVTAMQSGEADIVAFCLDRFDTCHVVVQEPVLTLDVEELRMKVGESVTLNATVTPARAKSFLRWAEDDFDINTYRGILNLQTSFTDTGILSNSVTALAAGEADIYVKCCNQIKKCHVIVEDIPHVITLEPSEISLNPTDSYTIAVKFTQYVEDVVMTNTDQKIANARLQTSSSGGRTVYVTALRPGKTTITVSAADGTAEPGTCVVTVNGALDGDVNCDGEVNTGDVSAIYGIILGTKPDNGRADLNGDSEVNVADVSALYGIILGVE